MVKWKLGRHRFSQPQVFPSYSDPMVGEAIAHVSMRFDTVSIPLSRRSRQEKPFALFEHPDLDRRPSGAWFRVR